MENQNSLFNQVDYIDLAKKVSINEALLTAHAASLDKMFEEIHEHHNICEKRTSELNDKLRALEYWRSGLIGAAILFSAIVGIILREWHVFFTIVPFNK